MNVAAPDLTPDANGRPLVLFEGRDNFGRLQPLLGTLGAGSLTWSDAITENPALNATERWEVYNATEDAHPIHIHLVKFQIENREDFDGVVLPKAQPQHDFDPETGFGLGQGGLLVGPSGVLGTAPELLGGADGPYAQEAGWKDTAVMLPGQVTRVISKFDKPGRYVWHCHILSHEDHEMMRPYYIGGMP
ncbi:MAG: multicopper oxidase domain-containing protein [Deltaproteobacteria bacterium]|nr:multicopper oxidase domain-containing protein [Deltaproteobacteria bacterium]